MKKTILMSALAMVLATQPALAAQFSFDFRADVNGDVMRGSGTLDTEDVGQDYYRVLGATGTFFMWDTDAPRTVTKVFGEVDQITGELTDAIVFNDGNWVTPSLNFETVGTQDQVFGFERQLNGLYRFSVSEVGARDVAFEIRRIAGAVPEPATWAMMILGFGVVGATMRRRKSSARVQFA